MKKLLFLLFVPLSAWSQDTLVIHQTAPLLFMDTVSVSITGNDDVTEFRIFHPTYGDAFWSSGHLAQYIVDSQNLTSSSSQFEIVSSIAAFYKKENFHVNSELIQNTTNHPGGPLTIVDHWSQQCGNYADKVANTCNEITSLLGIPSIVFRRVSLSAHQIMEYRDTVLHKWIYMDPDPGTSVFVPRDNGNLVSFADMQVSPNIILDPTTSVWWTMAANDSASRQQYYNFVQPILGTVNYYTPNIMTDDRDILYRIPENAVMQFTMINNKLSVPIDSLYGDNIVIINDCATAFSTNDTAGISDCIQNMANLSGLSTSVILQAIINGNTFLSHGEEIIGPKDSERFCSVTLQPGNYTIANLWLPNLLRSIEPTHEGVAFSVNGTIYTDSTFFQMYWPAGTAYLGNPQYINPSTIQYGVTDVSIPDSVGPITLTLYFNHRLFEFWEQDWKIIVLDGELETSQLDSTGTTSIDDYPVTELIQVYPNPTNGIINLSQNVERLSIYSATGSMLMTECNVLQFDISELPTGMYCLVLENQKQKVTKKIIKQ